MKPTLPHAFAAALLLTGCDLGTDTDFGPYLTTDTVQIYTPTEENAGLPSGLDIITFGGLMAGESWPERSRDAEQWAFTIRRSGDSLLLVPAAVIGLESGAAISHALEGHTFASLIEVPPLTELQDTTGVALVEGAIYAAGSRAVDCGAGASQQYAKIHALEVQPDPGMTVPEVTTNEYCGDLRLSLEGWDRRRMTNGAIEAPGRSEGREAWTPAEHLIAAS